MTEGEFRVPKATLLQRLKDGRQELDSALTRLSPDVPRQDGWTFKDVVAHLAAWERYSAERLRRLARTRVDPGPPPEGVDTFNDRAYHTSLEHTWDQVRRESVEASADLVETVRSLSEEVIAGGDWLAAWVALANGPWHYREHLPEFTGA